MRRPERMIDEDDLDLERIVYDPEYRSRVRDQLNGKRPDDDPGKAD